MCEPFLDKRIFRTTRRYPFILRPGRLTDDPGTGRINLGPWLKGADIPRADVAALLAACLIDDRSIGRQWEMTGGDTAIADAIAQAAG